MKFKHWVYQMWLENCREREGWKQEVVPFNSYWQTN